MYSVEIKEDHQVRTEFATRVSDLHLLLVETQRRAAYSGKIRKGFRHALIGGRWHGRAGGLIW